MHRRLARALGVALLGLGLLAPAALADDPTPAPVVFGTPQLLVWWDSHGTYNGPVTDNAYALIRPDQVDPADATHFILGDGTGGVYHYFGHVVSGPYAGQADLCPVMLSIGIDYLSAYPYTDAVGFSADDCRASLTPPATPEPAITPEPTVEPTPAATDDTGAVGLTVAPGDGSDDPVALGLATALILALLGIGGFAILAYLFGWGPFPGRSPSVPALAAPASSAAAVPPTPAPVSAPAPEQGQPDRSSDPCASQTADLATASAHARGLNTVLAGLRRLYANLDQQIVQIEDGAIPTELGVEIAFAAGGLAGGAAGGAGIVPETILGKMFENALKDVLKGVVKSSLNAGEAALTGGADTLANLQGGALEAMLKGMLEDQFASDYLSASMGGLQTSAFALADQLPRKFAEADAYAAHAAEAVGQLITTYNSGMELANLVQQSVVLRQKAMMVYGDIADLEVQHETALEKMRDTAERLAYCRKVNAPDWKRSPASAPGPASPRRAGGRVTVSLCAMTGWRVLRGTPRAARVVDMGMEPLPSTLGPFDWSVMPSGTDRYWRLSWALLAKQTARLALDGIVPRHDRSREVGIRWTPALDLALGKPSTRNWFGERYTPARDVEAIAAGVQSHILRGTVLRLAAVMPDFSWEGMGTNFWSVDEADLGAPFLRSALEGRWGGAAVLADQLVVPIDHPIVGNDERADRLVRDLQDITRTFRAASGLSIP